MIELSEIPSYLSGPALVCALVAFGLFVGVLTGLFGVGGGFVVTPLLNVLLGIPYNLSVGSSLSFIIGTSAAGTRRHSRRGNVDPKSMFIVAGWSMCGAVLGGMLNDALYRMLDGSGANGFTLTMHGLFIFLLLLTAWLVFRGPSDDRQKPSFVQRVAFRPNIHLRRAGLDDVSLPAMCVLGLAVGVTTGLLGIGGGVLLMPILLVGVGLRTRQAIGTSLGIVLFTSIAGTVKHGMVGNVALWIALPLLAGSSVGVQVGAWLCEVLHAGKIRRYFAVFVLIVVAAVAWDFVRKLMA